MVSIEDYGNLANEQAEIGDFRSAIRILNAGILEYPYEPRLYNNRCYCYMKLKLFHWAFYDAEYMIDVFPTYSRGYHRKVELLIEMEKYIAAEEALNDFFRDVPFAKEACIQKLVDIQFQSFFQDVHHHPLMDAYTAPLFVHCDTENLRACYEAGENEKLKRNIEYYPEDEDPDLLSGLGAMSLHYTTDENDYDPCDDPSNPLRSSSIWIGNITPRITENKIRAMFARYGKIKSIIVQHQNSCAFVNYTNPTMAATAMVNFPRKMPVEDTFLIIRFPENVKAATRRVANSRGN